MTFEPEKVDHFLQLFRESKTKISAFPGCHYLELLQSTKDPAVFFTYSYWENEQALENYRQSELFKSTWAKTKILFSGKPEAWSVRSLYVEY